MRIVPYIRVSSGEQAKSGLGLEAQLATIRAEAARRGADLVLHLGHPPADAGVKGDLPLEERPGLQLAIRLLRRGDVLMVAKLDRLSRCGAADTLAIESAIKRRGAKLVSAAGEGTEPRDKWDVGAHMTKDMAEVFSRLEKRHIAARTHAALQAKRARRELAGNVPFGWRAVRDGSAPRTKRGGEGARLEPHPVEQAAVAQILALRARGCGYRSICAALERGGHQPRGARWHPETVRSILAQAEAHPSQAPPFGSPTALRANTGTTSEN